MESIPLLYFSSRVIFVITVNMTTHASGVIAPIPWELLMEDLPGSFSATRAPRALGTFFLPRSRAREMTAVVEQTRRSTGWTSVERRTRPGGLPRFHPHRPQ